MTPSFEPKQIHPGEMAYDAYRSAKGGGPPWARLSDEDKAVWRHVGNMVARQYPHPGSMQAVELDGAQDCEACQ